jgi:HK97 family phage portal protein
MISDTLDRIYSASGWVSKQPFDDYWYESRGIETVAGVDIDEDAALAISTVFACVAKVSKTEASLPVQVIEREDTRTRRPVDHGLTELLTTAANDDATGLTARESAAANRELWGAAHFFVDWHPQTKEPVRFTHLPARDMDIPKRDENGELYWVYRPSGGTPEVIPASKMWYIPGFSLNGITGVSTVAYNRQLCGVAKATEQFKGAFFGNGAWAGGFIKRPEDAPQLSEEAAERWLSSLNEKLRGSSKAFGFALLREAMEFQQIEMPFKDAVFLDTGKPSRIAICGWFDVPLIMIQDDEHSTLRNTEQADIAFAKHSILPRLLRIEKSANKRFFRGTKLQLKFNLAGLVRGDFMTQMKGFALGRQWGIFSVNDCLELLDRNPVPGGDERLTPLNMVPLGTSRPTVIPPPDKDDDSQAALPSPSRPALPAPEQNGQQALATLRPAIQHAADLITVRQCKAVTAAFQKHGKSGAPDSFGTWAGGFFEAHAKIVRGEVEPIFRGYEEATGERLDVTAQDVAAEYCDQCLGGLLAAVNYPTDVPKLIEDWKENLAATIVERLCNLMTKEAANAQH